MRSIWRITTLVFICILSINVSLIFAQVPVISGGAGAPAGTGTNGNNNAGGDATGLGCGGGGGSWWGGTGGAGKYGGGGAGAGGYFYSGNINWEGGDGGQGVVVIGYFNSGLLISSVVQISGTSVSVPAGIDNVKVWAIGGGGGGGGATQNDGTAGGGGGAGGVAYISRTVSPGDLISYSLGAGGKGGHGSLVATAGGTTTATVSGITISATGGNQGTYNSWAIASGGSFSGGDGGANGGTGAGGSGDVGGGGGGGIGGSNGTQDGNNGGPGANAANVSDLFAACAIAGNPTAPAISSFSPTSGLAGTIVTIIGTGFNGALNVRFGGIPASSFTVNSDSQIQAVVAAGSVSGSVSVDLPYVTVSKPLYKFTAPVAPAISSFSPASGGLGTIITINGSNFLGTTSVSFGGTPAYSFTVNSDFQISAIVSTGSTGSVSVTSSSGTGTSPGFTYSGAAYLTWTGALSQDWNTAANWSPVVLPALSTSVVIPDVSGVSGNFPVIAAGQSGNCNNLTIESGADLSVKSTASGTGSLITSGTVSGNITIERYIAGSSDLTENKYHLVSIPLATSNNSLSSLFLGSYLYRYVPSSNSWLGLGNSTTTNLDEQVGYMIYYPNTSTTYSFSGEINSGIYSPIVTYEGNAGGNNFALVPNPYPSNIDWNAASGWTKTNIGNSIWVYNNGNYAIWNGSSSTNGGSRYIGVGQAFFIQTMAADPVFEMNNNVRTHTSAAFLKSTNTISNQLRVHADANGMADEVLIGFSENTTNEYAATEDALKFFGASSAPQLYTTSGEYKLSINNLSMLVGSVDVPLNFETEYEGEITFSFSQIESFLAGQIINLEDKLTGQMINLNQNPVYSFDSHPAYNVDRFVLHFGNTTGVDNPSASKSNVWFSGSTLYISAPDLNSDKAIVEVYNTAGQIVFQQQVILSNHVAIPLNLSGAVVARVVTSNEVLTGKAILFK